MYSNSVATVILDFVKCIPTVVGNFLFKWWVFEFSEKGIVEEKMDKVSSEY